MSGNVLEWVDFNIIIDTDGNYFYEVNEDGESINQKYVIGGSIVSSKEYDIRTYEIFKANDSGNALGFRIVCNKE